MAFRLPIYRFEYTGIKTTYLSTMPPWFGGHTGYNLLPKFVEQAGARVETVSPHRGRLTRVMGKCISLFAGLTPRNQSLTFAEFEFLFRGFFKGGKGVLHFLGFEEHAVIFSKLGNVHFQYVCTLHLPPSQWDAASVRNLGYLRWAIVLYRRDIPIFQEALGNGELRFIHHGVDTDFFRPGNRAVESRLLYGGVYLRNVAMLSRVIARIHRDHPEVKFDLLVPLHARSRPEFAILERHPAVTWHAGLNDEALRELYQNSYLLLLPMNDSGANNAVLEALACGVPVVTCDVGGIRDYGGGTIYPIVENDNDDAMVALVERYLERPAWRDEIGRKCRQFAEDCLAWPLIAEQHMRVYREMVS